MSNPATVGPLTYRQWEVLKLVAEGEPQKVVGLKLGISERTIKNHMTEIFKVLKAVSSPNAVAIGFRIGILQ